MDNVSMVESSKNITVLSNVADSIKLSASENNNLDYTSISTAISETSTNVSTIQNIDSSINVLSNSSQSELTAAVISVTESKKDSSSIINKVEDLLISSNEVLSKQNDKTITGTTNQIELKDSNKNVPTDIEIESKEVPMKQSIKEHTNLSVKSESQITETLSKTIANKEKEVEKSDIKVLFSYLSIEKNINKSTTEVVISKSNCKIKTKNVTKLELSTSTLERENNLLTKPPLNKMQNSKTKKRNMNDIDQLDNSQKLNSTPAKLGSQTSNTKKIITFFEKEFLAVRNEHDSFYLCKNISNVYKHTKKVNIQWLNDGPNNVYTEAYNDKIEFDCILTNVDMEKFSKNAWRLPEDELQRIKNILKRSIDVEKGIEDPNNDLDEEHPDGLDLRLYKDEKQLDISSESSASEDENEKDEGKELETKKQKIKTPTKMQKKCTTNMDVPTSVPKTKRIVATRKTLSSTKIEKPIETPKSPIEKEKPSSADDNTLKSDNKTTTPKKAKRGRPPKTSTTKSAIKQTVNASEKTITEVALTSPGQSPSIKRAKKGESKTLSDTTNSSLPSTAEIIERRQGKIRNAGSAVAAKICSASKRTVVPAKKLTSQNQRQKN